jgi:transposase-like protein
MTQKTGASAKNLQETMGFKTYQTAWVWLQKLRRAMIRPRREQLHGNVEVDEAYFGGKETGARGRQTITKTLVVVAIEVDGKKIGRVRFRCIPNASSESLMSFIQDTIKPGSTAVTDGWKGYNSLTSCGYLHEVKVATENEKDESKMLPHIHLVISLVKRWLMGTHQGAISSSYLEYYLDEYAFRFNRKLSTYRGKLFYRLMQQAVTNKPIPLKAITGNKSG